MKIEIGNVEISLWTSWEIQDETFLLLVEVLYKLTNFSTFQTIIVKYCQFGTTTVSNGAHKKVNSLNKLFNTRLQCIFIGAQLQNNLKYPTVVRTSLRWVHRWKRGCKRESCWGGGMDRRSGAKEIKRFFSIAQNDSPYQKKNELWSLALHCLHSQFWNEFSHFQIFFSA